MPENGNKFQDYCYQPTYYNESLEYVIIIYYLLEMY